MVAACAVSGGKVATWDADVPAEYRMNMDGLIALLKAKVANDGRE
jgi:hypothetical protein